MSTTPSMSDMSPESRELLVCLLSSVFKDHTLLVLEEYTGVEVDASMQRRLQGELDDLVEMWVAHGMVNGGFRLHANYVGEPPMLDTTNPIRKEIVDPLGVPSIIDSIKEGMATPISECSTELDWGPELSFSDRRKLS